MRYFFIFYMMWGIVWGASNPDLNENIIKKKFNGIILRADLPSGKEIHFIPSEHVTPLENFSDFFRKLIDQFSKQKATLILEMVSVVSSVEELKNAPLKQVFQYANKDYLNKINGLQTAADKPWSLGGMDESIEENYKNVFFKIAKMAEEYFEKIDLSHLYNIYEMKPGVVFAFYWQISSILKGAPYFGMDHEITEKFKQQLKPLIGLETYEDLIYSLPFASATLEDIRDDFLSPDEGGAYWDSLQAMHDGFNLDISRRRLSNEASLAIRNKKWMLQYEDLFEKHGECLAVHGQAHFVGESGLINLGQQKGWKWSVLREDGLYKRFTYYPNEAIEQFKYE